MPASTPCRPAARPGSPPRPGSTRSRTACASPSQQGSHPNKAFQAAASDGYQLEVLETLDPETPALSRDRLLKERLAHWLDAKGGRPL